MIKDITELNFPKIDGRQYATLSQATVSVADMGEKTITTQLKIDGNIVPDFSFDWEVEFQGEKYIMPLRIPQGAKGNEILSSTIDLTFQHWAIYQLKRWAFVTIQQIAAGTYLPDNEEATVQLNLGDFCTLFGQVLSYYFGNTITIDLNPAWQYKQEATIITISHTKIWNVLIDAFYNKYGVRWEIKAASGNSNTVKGGERYVIRVGYPTTEVDHIFEYGFEGGLLKIERQVQSEEIRNMLKGRGGETNIPFRYFKNIDPNNPDFRPDPDWVEELANIYFTNLMPATFRSYVQGWKAAHISKYPGYTAVGESNAYAPWAYRKGYTDTKFQPVEFVADEITTSPTTGDKQVEILPGYSPYVKKGSSLDKYGPLPDTLNNNDEIYPTIQGTGLDVAVAVEQILSDDVEESAESDAKAEDKVFAPITVKAQPGYGTAKRSSNYVYFSVPVDKMANIEGYAGVKAYRPKDNADMSHLISELDYTIKVFSSATGEQHAASGIPAGSWYFTVEFSFNNTSEEELNVTCSFNEAKVVSATPSEKWRNTFDIWVKNIWDSSKGTAETNEEYSERVWKPVLGDKEGNTAKVVFTSGALAISEDYEFTIVGFPAYDTSKTYGGAQSHWRIKLAKSEAELEATGLYVPSTKKQGKAGDTFVFIGTEMTHVPYVTDAEERLDNWKKDQLGEKKEIKPTFIVTTDRVRINGEGKADALINELRAGNTIRLADKRFIQPLGNMAYETLYLQSVTYTYREPTSDDAALNPDVEIVLGNEYTTSANPVSMMQGEISALQQQLGSISNIEQIVRAVGDKLYLRKDGISDRSLSPTQFFSLLTSGDFRAGMVGGAGWGFYKDANGNWVLEADKINARQELQTNSLVINQVEGRGGMIVESAAAMEITLVEETETGYVCHFDQKNGTVANLFHLNDVAYCQRFTPENGELKYYRRRVVAVGTDSVTLSDTDVNGSGIPEEGDNIVHFGNYVDKTRQYVKVRDVINGGYERYIEGLDSVSADGTEYYFVGRQYGMYGGKPRWFIGDPNGEYAEWINGKLNIKGSLSIGSTIGGDTFEEYIKKVSPPVKQEDIEQFVNNIVNPKLEGIQNQIDGVIETWFYNGVPTLTNYPANGWNTEALKIQHRGDLYYDNDTGTAYRFSKNEQGVYYWNVITDDAITKALAAAQKAQDTADGKRRVFTAQPTTQQEYDPGDLWVNATYGTQYSNDLLRCVTHKDAGTAFNIEHWTLATNYTDDSALDAFKVAYQQTISIINQQIDKKAETWYQATDPAANWTTAAQKSEHEGDLWYNTTTGKTYYYNGTQWQYQDIPEEVFDKIDGKSSIYVSKPTSYRKNDLWILEAAYTLSGVEYTKGELVTATEYSNTFNAAHWTKKVKYTDDTLANQVKQQVDELSGTVNNVSNTVNGLKNFTDTAFSDGIIDRSEASAIQTYLKNIETAQKEVQRAYASLDANTLLPTESKTALANAKAAFDSAANALVAKITEVIADGIATSEERATVNALYTTFNTKYGDFVYALNQANAAIMGALNININKLGYLSAAMKELTTIQNGLILSSVVSLGVNNADFTTQTTYSGISGIHDDTKRGGGIAAWYGGDMIDKFDYYNASTGEFNIPSGTRVAMGLDRMDGTGYRANGNLWWDANGVVHADPLSFFVGESTVGALLASFQVVLKADGKHPDYLIPQVPFQSLTVASSIKIGNGYLKWDEANKAFYVEQADGTAANFYATGGVSALGMSSISGGGGSGGGLVESIYRWADLGGTFSDSANDTFNAYTINKIRTDLMSADSALSSRITSLEGGAAVTVTTTGSGNAITAISKTGNIITATKGATFLTAITKAQVEAVLTGNITSHTHNSIKDVGDGRTLQFNYSTNELNYNQFTWVAVWNGNTLQTCNKNLFATAASLANYVPWSKQSMATVNSTNLNPQFLNIENEILIADYRAYWSVINFGSYSGGNFRSQIAMPYQDSITDTDMFIRTANGTSWRSWRRVLHSGNTYLSGGVITINGSSITPLTAHQSLANYVTLNTAQTITASKRFTDKLIVAGDWVNDNGIYLYEGVETNTYGGYLLYGKSDKLHLGTWNNSTTGIDAMEIARGSRNVVFFGNIIKSGGTSAQFLKADGSVDGNSYLTTGTASSTYVKKSGDTMTGALMIKVTGGNNYNEGLRVCANNNWSSLMLLGSDNSAATGTSAKSWGLFNYNGDFYLSKNGSSISSGNVLSNISGVWRANGNTLWHAGNDGSGSGLDADLLDGVHASGLFTALSSSKETLSLTIGGTQKSVEIQSAGITWTVPTTVGTYSKLCHVSNYSSFILTVQLSQNNQSSLHTYLVSTGYDAAKIIQIGYNGYSNNAAAKIRVTSENAITFDVEILNRYGYNGATSINVYCKVFSLHPGAYISPFTVYIKGSGTVKSEITSSSNSIVANISGNATSATQLQTARTIWGQSFNGTGNVDGTLSIRPTTSNYTEGLRIHSSTNLWTTLILCGTDNTGDKGTSANSWGMHTYAGNFYLNRNACNSTTPSILCCVNNNWGIATSSPAYKLHVNGTVGVGGLLTTTTGSNHSGIRLGNSYLTAIDSQVIFQNLSAIRFGTSDSWDWNVWAGIRYDSANKHLYMGFPTGSPFNYNTAASTGQMTLPGVTTLNVPGAIAASGAVTASFLGVTADSSGNKTDISRGSFELFHSTPFIDFHFGRSTADYTSRIIADASNLLTISSNARVIGKLYVGQITNAIEWDASNSAFKFNGNLYATGGISALGASGLSGGGSSGSDGTFSVINLGNSDGYKIRFGTGSDDPYIKKSDYSLLIGDPQNSGYIKFISDIGLGEDANYNITVDGDAYLESLYATSITINGAKFTRSGTEIYVTISGTRYKLTKAVG